LTTSGSAGYNKIQSGYKSSSFLNIGKTRVLASRKVLAMEKLPSNFYLKQKTQLFRFPNLS